MKANLSWLSASGCRKYKNQVQTSITVPTIQEIERDVSRAFFKKARAVWRLSLFVKITMCTLASSAIAIVQFMDIPTGGALSIWKVVGIASAVIAAVGGIFVIVTERDASSELALAQNAIDEAKRTTESFNDVELALSTYQDDLERLIALYSATMSMRGVIEQSHALGVTDELKIIDGLMEASSRLFLVALGFKQSDLYTVCVYKAQIAPETKKVELRCVSMKRAIKCDMSGARKWPEGVGTVGIAFSNAREVIVPDMQAAELGTTFDLGAMARPEDRNRYRSVATVPVIVGREVKPWGVVVATSDQPHHFYVDEDTGVRTSEAVRALAGMVALAVTTCRKAPPAVGPKGGKKP